MTAAAVRAGSDGSGRGSQVNLFVAATTLNLEARAGGDRGPAFNCDGYPARGNSDRSTRAAGPTAQPHCHAAAAPLLAAPGLGAGGAMIPP